MIGMLAWWNCELKVYKEQLANLIIVILQYLNIAKFKSS